MSIVEKTSAPALANGQRLRQAEFHGRYAAMPPGIKAELVGGVVVMASPVGNPHGVVCNNAGLWLGYYKSRTPGTQAADNATTIIDHLGELQPDAWLRILPDRGGQTRSVGKFIQGVPELVVEVADSSRGIDLGAKLAEYERAGVLEFVVFALEPDEVYWHVRQGDRLIRILPGGDGLYRSTTFPGLWLDPVALFDDDGVALMATLDRGLAMPEYAEFAARLAAG